jgi:uncharacterized membrane protein YecN with MAPEG domain
MIQFVPISSAYAGLLAILLLVLSFHVVMQRRANRVGLGDKDVESLKCAIRAHANFAEYVPMALLLIVLAELNGATALYLNATGSLLVVSRILHGWGLAHSPGTSFGRFFGTLGTWIVIAAGAAINLYVGFV